MTKNSKDFRQPFRTIFAKEIITEFLPPVKQNKNSQTKIIILCSGLPSVPQKDELINFLAQKGFWVFFPRYRGTWESEGKFLKKSPHQDVLDIIKQLPKGFKSSDDNKTIKLKPNKIFVFGSSFGGPAAILSSKDSQVSKIVTFSSVVDWQKQEKTVEPLDYMKKYIKEYFGRAFNFDDKDWNKLKSGKFYNPANEVRSIDGKKILMLHWKDDDVVPWEAAQNFVEQTGSKFMLFEKGGHTGFSSLFDSEISQKVFNFIK